MIKERYLLAEQTIGEDDIQSLIEWLRSNPWLTQGSLVREFEARWSKWLGVKYSIFVNSGSSANLLMYYSLLLSNKLKNKKVIVPAVSWATTVAPAIQLGFEPIMCEANLEDFGLDLEHLETLLKKHDPGSVVAVHVLGVPNDMTKLLELKNRYNFLLMEDACAATGSSYDSKFVGNFGEISTFSFFYGHHLSTIEGGMVCTNNEEIYDLLLHIRSHGWPKDISPEKEAEKAKHYQILEFNRPFTFYYPGFNVRSTDLNAKIGLSQIKKIDYVITRRIENHKIYQQRFQAASDFKCQRNDRAVICSIAFAALAKSTEHRDAIARSLREKGIETRPLGGGNMSRQPFWCERYGTIELPAADLIHTTTLQLPNHPGLTPEDVNYICDVVINKTKV